MDPSRRAISTRWIVAHRGGLRDAPENTRAAFDAALDVPVDGIEFDVQMTRDDIPVLHHDGNLHKITGRYQRIADMDYDALAGIDWGGWFHGRYRGERIMTLTDALDRYAGRTRLLVEIKSFLPDRREGRSDRIAARVQEILRARVHPDRRDHIRILSFDAELLRRAHDRDAGWRYVLNTLDPDALRHDREGALDFLDAWSVPVKRLTSSFVDQVHAGGKTVMTWSCNTLAQLRRAWRTGADVIMTDRPAWAVGRIREDGALR